MVLKEVSYEANDPTIDSQVITLQSAGVDVVITAALPKFTVQMIRKLADLKWKPVDIISYVSASIGGVLVPAGLENAVGVTSTTWVYAPNYPTIPPVAGDGRSNRDQLRRSPAVPPTPTRHDGRQALVSDCCI